MKTLNALDPYHVALRRKMWEHNVRAIDFPALSNFAHSAQKDTINLGRGNHGILHKKFRSAHEVVNLAFSKFNTLRVFASDEDFIWVTPIGIWRAVPRQLSERWKVNSRVRCRFNQLDVLSRSTTHDRMQSALEVEAVDLPSQLRLC